MVINICFCIDENYVDYLSVVLRSISDTNRSNRIDFYIISNGLSIHSMDKLLGCVQRSNFRLFFVSSSDEDISNLEAGGHISSATYIRFDIPYLLKHLDKVIYLDADLIVKDDLFDLWQTEIDGFFVGAVTNPFFERYESINLAGENGYFNAGVLIINTKMWREFKVKEYALKFLNEYKNNAIMFDQDALNYVFRGNWKSLSVRWNIQTSYLQSFRKLNVTDRFEIGNALKHPGIIHFSSASKPWNFLDSHPMRDAFLSYVDNKSEIITKPKGVSHIKLVTKYVYWKFKYYWQLRYL
jgi:lipopolysaccharide biosynthesis glycosyltransferase